MKPYAKEDWVRDLRSGEFRQTTGALVNNECMKGPSYCCLGVAALGLGLIEPDDDREVDGTLSGIMTRKRIPWEQQIEVFTTLGIPLPPEGGQQESLSKLQQNLSTLNDHGFNFRQIAELIEAGEVAIRSAFEDLRSKERESEIDT